MSHSVYCIIHCTIVGVSHDTHTDDNHWLHMNDDYYPCLSPINEESNTNPVTTDDKVRHQDRKRSLGASKTSTSMLSTFIC
jgi:hypothetical protein